MNKNKTKRIIFSLLVFGVGMTPQSPAYAADNCPGRFADETIRWIVPSAAGGGYDTYSRLIAPYYEQYTGADVVVQNRAGAGGRIGAAQIMNAAPDGLTMGILNGPGLMMASLYETTPVPDPAEDFTILGRVASSRHVWAVAAGASLPPLQTLLKQGQVKPVVFGTRGPGTLSFVDIVLVSHILNLDVEIITGFKGSRDGILGVLRGDIDAVAHSWGSLESSVESGDLRPWLQIHHEPVSDNAAMNDVPVLAGPDGLAVLAAQHSGTDPERAVARARALVELFGAGRLIAAPLGLDPELAGCMRDALHAALTDTSFIASARAAGRALDVARGEEAETRLRAVRSDARAFASILRAASDAYSH